MARILHHCDNPFMTTGDENTLNLDHQQEGPADVSRGMADPRSVTGSRVLLVDDSEANLLGLAGLLRLDGVTSVLARSGPEALDLLSAHDVALAIIDVKLPGMTGLELATLMRGDEGTHHIPIIFVTALAPSEDRRFRGYEAGAVDVLFKPIDPHDLRSKVAVFLELHRQREQLVEQRDQLIDIATRLQSSEERLREADRRKDEYLAILAHELRNPLAPVRTAVAVLQTRGNLDPVAAHCRDIIDRQIAHMARLLDDLLDVSRLSRGQLTLRRLRVRLDEVLDASIETSRPLIEQHHHCLEISRRAPDLTVDADATRLIQVFGNLLHNAAKYTPAGGRIDLTVERAEEWVIVRIRDNGTGLAPEALERVFDLFARAHDGLPQAADGLGIGLSLSRQLVEMHGGTIQARSEGVGRGSEFIVRLPLCEGPTNGAGMTPAVPATKTSLGRRVVIADDNVDAADTVAWLLREHGCTVSVAYDGAAAVEAAELVHPDLLVLDLGMPGIDGVEVCRQIRRRPWSGATTIIALTGRTIPIEGASTALEGFDRYLVKPVDPEELLRAVRETRRAQPETT